MIETTWIEDAAATRLLNVMEERASELENATNVLSALVERYFSVLNIGEEKRKAAELASADYNTICATLALVQNSLLDLDADLSAALNGSDPRVTYRKRYEESITEQEQ